jgi:hypothetical protein
MVKMWTSVNIDPRNTDANIDKLLGINGLSDTLKSKISSDVYCNLNICVNSLGKKIPDGHSLYILGFWFEIFDENIFIECYNNNPTAEFIILTDLQANDLSKLNRCKVINLYHWKWFIKQGIKQPNYNQKQFKYKLSSLSNRVNEYRAFITLKLMDQKDVFVTWNAKYIQNMDIGYIFSSTGRSKRDALLKNIDQLQNPINQEKFTHPIGSIADDWSYSAYSETLVNSINETKEVSYHADIGILPGPYLSEKTWKPLLYGNGLLFTGQFNTCKTLSELGFVFDYPWSNAYDDLPGDLDRLEIIFDIVDRILGMSHSSIESGIKDSVEYNQHFFNSEKIIQTIDQRNDHGLEQLTKYL